MRTTPEERLDYQTKKLVEVTWRLVKRMRNDRGRGDVFVKGLGKAVDALLLAIQENGYEVSVGPTGVAWRRTVKSDVLVEKPVELDPFAQPTNMD